MTNPKRPYALLQGHYSARTFTTLDAARKAAKEDPSKGPAAIYHNIGRGWWDEADRKRNLIEEVV